MRKRLTLDILGISDADQEAIRELAIKHCGKPSISNYAKKLLCNALTEHNYQNIYDDSVVRIKKNRIEVRLYKKEIQKLSQLAQPHHMTINTFVASVIRGLLNKTPLFTAAEVEVLYQSNSQLLRIGRNLNQIARQLNSMEGGSITSEQITSLQRIIDTHTEKVGDLLLANRRRNNE